MILLDWIEHILNNIWRLLLQFPGLALLFTSISPPINNDLTRSQAYLNSNPRETWHKYIRASPDRTIHPSRILTQYTKGNVTNAKALLNGTGLTVLARNNSSSREPVIVVDFGHNTVGLVKIEFAGSTNFTNGRPGLRLAFSETLQFLSDRSDFSRSYNGDTITPGTDQIAVQSKNYTWLNQHGCQHNKQVCSDGLHGFRYLKIYLDALGADAPYTTSYGSISIKSISLQLSAFYGAPSTFTGYFESSDKDLNQWWYDSVYTNDLCTDVFRKNDTEPRNAYSPTLDGKLVLHDGPKRDRDPYVGDLAVASRTSYLSHDTAIATRNVLADLAEHQRFDGWIPPASIVGYNLPLLDYPLYWVTCSYDYLMHTGDVEYIKQYYHVFERVLDNYYPSITDPKTHLITKGIHNSGGYGDYAFLPRTGAVTYYNALYVLALKNAAFIAKHLDLVGDAQRWTQRATKVSDAINKHRFDDKVGAFYDGDCDSAPCETHAQDGNSIAILSGVVPPHSSRAKSILDHLSTHHSRKYGNAFYDNDRIGNGFSDRVYAFISYFEISARFLSSQPLSALEEIRRLYGWMASQDPGVTVWEGIGRNGEPYEGGFTSMSHGWSTGIVPLLTNYVLGVTARDVGYKRWMVKPYMGDLKWARGKVPTPFGAIEVSWERKGEWTVEIEVDAPAGTGGVVVLPVGEKWDVDVWVDDILIAGGKEIVRSEAIGGDGFIGVEVGEGRHVVSTIPREKGEV